MEEKKFTFHTKAGSWRLFVLLMAFVFLFGFIAQAIVTQGYKVSVTEVNMELRGGNLNMEVYRPTNIAKGDKLPCMILAHGGSECLATPVIHAWEYAKRGYVVINVSMYGAGLSDMPEYMEDGADETNYSRNSGTHGLWDALQYARAIDYVDSTRIGIWGHSQGYTIGCTVPIYDGNLFTLNDRLLNILYDEFGVEISEEDLLRNADEIAEPRTCTQSSLQFTSTARLKPKRLWRIMFALSALWKAVPPAVRSLLPAMKSSVIFSATSRSVVRRVEAHAVRS